MVASDRQLALMDCYGSVKEAYVAHMDSFYISRVPRSRGKFVSMEISQDKVGLLHMYYVLHGFDQNQQ